MNSLLEILKNEIEKVVNKHPTKIIELNVLEDRSEARRFIYVPTFISDLPFGKFITDYVLASSIEKEDKWFFIVDIATLVHSLIKKYSYFVRVIDKNDLHHYINEFIDFSLFENKNSFVGEYLDDIEAILDLSFFIRFMGIRIGEMTEKEIESLVERKNFLPL